jgi:DNA primase
LDTAGAMTIIVLTDNDQAGKEAQKTILNKCQKTHRIFCPAIAKNDVGDMTKEEIQTQIIDYLRKIK